MKNVNIGRAGMDRVSLGGESFGPRLSLPVGAADRPTIDTPSPSISFNAEPYKKRKSIYVGETISD